MCAFIFYALHVSASWNTVLQYRAWLCQQIPYLDIGEMKPLNVGTGSQEKLEQMSEDHYCSSAIRSLQVTSDSFISPINPTDIYLLSRDLVILILCHLFHQRWKKNPKHSASDTKVGLFCQHIINRIFWSHLSFFDIQGTRLGINSWIDKWE